MIKKKKIVIVWGNCVTGIHHNILKQISIFTKYFELYYFPIDALRTTEITEQEKKIIEVCDIFIMQRGHLQFPSFFDNLPTNCQVITFPVIRLHSLWPLYRVDPRNKGNSEEGFPFGKYPYGDKVIISLLKKGLTSQEVYDEYMAMNISDKINLDKFHTENILMGKELEKKCDLKIYDYIEEHFFERRFLYSFNHPTPELFAIQVEQILDTIMDVKKIDNLKKIIEKMNPLENIQLPIHPQIIDYFKLEWVSKDYKYKYGLKEYLTFQQYYWNYINFI